MKPEAARESTEAVRLLDVEGMSVFYDRIQAVWDVTFAVREHRVTALVGSNGAGKSAIMRTIAGTVPLAKGTIRFQGEMINGLSPHRRVEMGISLVPEGRKVFPYLSVKENLDIGAYNRRARRDLDKSLQKIFEVFPVLKARHKQVAGSLSGGEQQMLVIGRALMSHPKLLMLDEPSLGLAPLMVKRVFEVIEKIHTEGVTILLVEQNVRQTLQHAQKAYILEIGRITLEGRGPVLLEDPHVKKAYLGL